MRKEFCEKDGIRITYTDDNVCFENISTAESVLFSNEGKVLHTNFDEKTTLYYAEYLKKIASGITAFRNLDTLETA